MRCHLHIPVAPSLADPVLQDEENSQANLKTPEERASELPEMSFVQARDQLAQMSPDDIVDALRAMSPQDRAVFLDKGDDAWWSNVWNRLSPKQKVETYIAMSDAQKEYALEQTAMEDQARMMEIMTAADGAALLEAPPHPAHLMLCLTCQLLLPCVLSSGQATCPPPTQPLLLYSPPTPPLFSPRPCPSVQATAHLSRPGEPELTVTDDEAATTLARLMSLTNKA